MKITSYYIDNDNVMHTYICDAEHVTISDVFSDQEAERLIDELNRDDDENT